MTVQLMVLAGVWATVPVTVQVTVPAGAWTAVLAMARVAELAGAWVMVLAMLQVSMPVTMQVATLVHSSSAVGSACHTAPVEQHLCTGNGWGGVPGLAGGAIPPASPPRFLWPVASKLGGTECELKWDAGLTAGACDGASCGADDGATDGPDHGAGGDAVGDGADSDVGEGTNDGTSSDVEDDAGGREGESAGTGVEAVRARSGTAGDGRRCPLCGGRGCGAGDDTDD